MQQKLTTLEAELSDKLRSSELKNVELEAEIQTLKQQIEEQNQTRKELNCKLKSMQDERSSTWNDCSNSEENFEFEVVMKELESKLHTAERKLAEKENVIAELEASSKLTADEHNKKLKSLESKVEASLADKLQAESKLTERDQEIKDLKDMHKQQLQEGQKVLAEVQTQLHLELSKKSEAGEKYVDLIDQMGSMDVTLKNRDAELISSSSEIAFLKEKVQNLEIKLNEAAEECTKAWKEKENLGLCLVGSLKAVTQLKLSLHSLRTDAYCNLNCIKEEVSRMGFQVMDVFDLAKEEVEAVRTVLQEKNKINSNLRENLSLLEKQLSEHEANIKSERNLEGMLEDLRLSKENLEAEVSENNALIRKLQHELQNMTKTLEKKEQETSKLHDNMTDLQKELTQKMEKANEDLVNLESDYRSELQSKDTKIRELKNEHDECSSKIMSLQVDVNMAESKVKEISENYKNLKLENEKLDKKAKELEEQCQSLKLELIAVTDDGSTLAGTVDELTCDLTKHKKENNALKEKIERLVGSLSDSNSEVTGLRIQIEKLSNELMKVIEEKQALEGQIEDVQEAKLKVVESLKLQERSWNNKSESDEVKIKELEMEFQSLQKELKNEKQQFELLISNLSSQLEQSQQAERLLSAEAESLKEEIIKGKGDQSDLRFRLEQTEQREQLLSAQIENISKENTSQGQLLKEKQEQLEIMAAEVKSVLSRSKVESILEMEAKLVTLNKEKEKWVEERLLLETKEKDIKQFSIKLEEQLNMELQRIKLLEEECKSLKESNDLFTKQFEELNTVVDSLRKKNKENYELIEHLKAEKTALKNTINADVTQGKEFADKIQDLQSKVIYLRSENATFTSERELMAQQLEELRKELQDSISEGRVVDEIRLDLEKVLMEKNHLEKQFGNLLQEKQTLVEQLNDERNSRKGKEEDERLRIEKVYMENKDLQKQLDSALKEKLDLEQTSIATTENLERLQREMAEQERCHLVIDELMKQLEDTLQEKTDLEHRLSAEIEKSRGMHDLEKLLAGKEHQLDKILIDMQTKEKQFVELEDIHAQKIKHLVNDFEKQQAGKDEELINLEDKEFGM
jgi:chromosome segregation ATPase